MDALTLHALCRELSASLVGARVEKIHQPNARELVVTLRTKDRTERLLLSAHRQYARVHLLHGERPQNPEEPPMFCMLLRKRLESGRLVAIRQQGWDRVLELAFEAQNDIGDLVTYLLIVEMMGKHSNVILTTTDPDGRPQRIIDSIVHVTRDMSRVRQVLPGLDYQPAPPLNKRSFDQVTADDIELLELASLPAKQQKLKLSQLVAGMGPLAAAEILHRAGSLAPGAVVQAIQQVFQAVLQGAEPASLGLDALGVPQAAAPFLLTHLPAHQTMASIGAAVEALYREWMGRIHTSHMASELERVVNQHLDKLRGKRQKLLEQQEDSQDHEQLRIRGELLTAYPHLVPKGASEVTLPNFYDEDRPLTIDLHPAQSAIENAQRYFKQASKKKRALPLLEQELAQVDDDMRYLENVLVHLQDATPNQLEGLREELVKEGFLSERPLRRQRRKPSPRNKPATGQPDTFVSTDGYTILVGRNNAQNDRLTLKSSQPFDVWLHVKDMPGSHVVIRAPRNRPVPERTLHEAALLAAYFSKGRDSANVAVDYTEIRNVWKPSGSRPGHVLYKHQHTLYVTPDRPSVAAIMARQPASSTT